MRSNLFNQALEQNVAQIEGNWLTTWHITHLPGHLASLAPAHFGISFYLNPFPILQQPPALPTTRPPLYNLHNFWPICIKMFTLLDCFLGQWGGRWHEKWLRTICPHYKYNPCRAQKTPWVERKQSSVTLLPSSIFLYVSSELSPPMCVGVCGCFSLQKYFQTFLEPFPPVT